MKGNVEWHNRSERLRVVVATPLAEQHCELIERLEPRIDLIRDQSLYPPMRHPADFSGDPSFRRTPDSAASSSRTWSTRPEALYGIPDVDPTALRRTADANPGLRWVHTMAAGGGGQVKGRRTERGPAERESSSRPRPASTADRWPSSPSSACWPARKDLGRLLAQQRDRRWTGRWEMRQVSEMTVLVVGLGGIGQEVVEETGRARCDDHRHEPSRQHRLITLTG